MHKGEMVNFYGKHAAGPLTKIYGGKRVVAREARLLNIKFAKRFSDLISTSIGPLGSCKLILDEDFGMFATSDSGTIVRLISRNKSLPPVVRIMAEAARGLEKEVGDGVASMIILIGELLSKAGDLLEKGVHPRVIMDGYKLALKRALEILRKTSFEIPLDDKGILEHIAKSSVKGYFPQHDWTKMCRLALDALSKIAVFDGHENRFNVDLDYVKIVKVEGEGYLNTQLISGVILDRKRLEPGVPKRIKNARVLLLNVPVKAESFTHKWSDPDYDVKFEIEKLSHVKGVIEERNKLLRDKIEKIASIGANVVVSTGEIDGKAINQLARNGVIAIRWASKLDLRRISKISGANIVSNIEGATESDVGVMDKVEEVEIGGKKMIVFERSSGSGSVSFLVRGANRFVTEEAERYLTKMLKVLKSIFEKNRVVHGGGAAEITVSLELRQFAKDFHDKRQIAIEKFAEALEEIPIKLAKNTGLDPLSTLTSLKKLHNEGVLSAGINVNDGSIDDMEACRIMDPLLIKEHVLKAAVETALIMIKVDEIIVNEQS